MIGTTHSCKKEDAPDIYEPDSGYYDPSSYFPLKWGAYWVYELKNGETFQVKCGPHDIDSVKERFTIYAYNYHGLSSDLVNYHDVAAFTPGFNGKFWGTSLVGYACIKGGPYSIGFSSGEWGLAGRATRSWVCGSAGPNQDFYYICVDSAIQIDGFSNVFSYAYITSLNEMTHLLDSVTTNQTGMLSYHLPILPAAGQVLGKTYYAQGIGIIRKEIIDEQGQVVDYLRLITHYFP